MGADGKWGHGFSLLLAFGMFCSVIFGTNMRLAGGAAVDPHYYYYGAGRKIPLRLSNRVLALRFKEAIDSEEQENGG